MTGPSLVSLRAAFVVTMVAAGLAGCASTTGVQRVRLSERECLARAMYFESNRSSDAGMLAVGTVVMNRLKSGKYGSTICQVVGAKNQFAPGVLTRPMTDRGAPRARRVADAVLAGRRHGGVGNAHFFHTAGYKFPYRNMKYVLVAGGNAFYEKKKPPKTWWGGDGRWGPPPPPTERIDGGPIMVARNEIIDDRPARTREAPIEVVAAEPAPRPPVERPIQVARNEAPVPQYEPLPDARRQESRQAARQEVEEIPQYEPLPDASARTARREPARSRVEPQRSYEVAQVEEPRDMYGSPQSWRSQNQRIESRPLAAPAGTAAPRPTRVAAREPLEYRAPPPAREPTPAELGWQVGPQPVADYGSASRDAEQYARTGETSSHRYERQLEQAAEPDDDEPVRLRAGDSISR
ncbi:cell wall hydrolase [Hansschlegelia beijingensis]|uniref:Spore germination cell wall hydrolase CwlJ-like protein n=1 Tax=Hansschlegelia beijingensis TaxID=1133344 RepID=A0A7W6CXX0_9HYPH|nr:spore germination cell wall hydrolase CwlJ-like protein [Hansschlegelia beijingensis]